MMIDLYNWWFISLLMFLGYFLVAGFTFYLFNYFFKRRLAYLKIQKKYPTPKKIIVEIKYSIITLLIYAVSSWLIYESYELGWTQIYFDINDRSMLYWIFSLVLMIIIHDAYFYWSHRLMHQPKLFKIIHLTHHRSINPTPFASFSFHPLEAIISIGYIPIIIFLIPCHPMALFIFLTIMISINIFGHLGYELFSNRVMENRLGKWINASTYHNRHHKEVNYNFGLYFTFWDRIMKTFKN